jgi:uncharacterized protein
MVRPPAPVRPPAFPLALDRRGRTATAASPRAHAEQLIAELLITVPGERLNRPTLGSGLMALVFEPGAEELQAAAEFQIAAQLQQWLSGVVQVVGVAATPVADVVPAAPDAGTVALTVTYRLPGDGPGTSWAVTVTR